MRIPIKEATPAEEEQEDLERLIEQVESGDLSPLFAGMINAMVSEYDVNPIDLLQGFVDAFHLVCGEQVGPVMQRVDEDELEAMLGENETRH